LLEARYRSVRAYALTTTKKALKTILERFKTILIHRTFIDRIKLAYLLKSLEKGDVYNKNIFSNNILSSRN